MVACDEGVDLALLVVGRNEETHPCEEERFMRRSAGDEKLEQLSADVEMPVEPSAGVEKLEELLATPRYIGLLYLGLLNPNSHDLTAHGLERQPRREGGARIGNYGRRRRC